MSEHCIFLTGCGFKKSVWNEVMHFDKKFIALNLPSEDSIEKIAAEIGREIPRDSTIIGWSLGGVIAIYLAYYYPHLCKKLILVSASPQFREENSWRGIPSEKILILQTMLLENKMTFEDYFLQLVQYPIKNTSLKKSLLEHVEINNQTINHLNLIQTLDLKDAYQSLTIPIHYLIGERDAILKSDTAQQLNTLNPRTQITILLNAGHALPLTHAKDIYDHIKR